MKTVEVTCSYDPPAATGRVDRVVQQLTGLSRAGVRGVIDHGCVTVNNTACTAPQTAINRGDVVRVQYDPHRRYKELPKTKPDPAFELLFEDEHVLVVNKSPHVFTVPTATDKGKTLMAALEQHIARNKARTPSRSTAKSLHIVQRLDRGVSGVLVVAKSAKAASQLREQFATHKPQRIYIAIVSGVVEQKKGTFRTYMATGATLDRYSTNKPGKGELAITHYEVQSVAHDATVVRVQLETGRRNQIRVHFAEDNHPVLGDRRYRPDLAQHPRWKARRMALHAMSLEFIHPATGKIMRFEAELPAEFKPFMKTRTTRRELPGATKRQSTNDLNRR